MPLPPLEGPNDKIGTQVFSIDSAIDAANFRRPEDEMATYGWMVGLEGVSAADFELRATGVPCPEASPPTQTDFDRVVRAALADKLTERVHLRRRVETVHNNGELDDTESVNVALRALWAVPLVLITNSIQAMSKPLARCCSVTLKAPVSRGWPDLSGSNIKQVDLIEVERRPDATAVPCVDAAIGKENDVLHSRWCEPHLPHAARSFCQTTLRLPLGKFPASEVSAMNDAGSAAAANPNDDASQRPGVQSETTAAHVMQARHADAIPEQLKPTSSSHEEGPHAPHVDVPKEEQLKKPRKPKGDRASAISVAPNMKSGVGNLLGAYAAGTAKLSRPKGDRASAISMAQTSQSAAGALLTNALQPTVANAVTGNLPKVSEDDSSAVAPLAPLGREVPGTPSERPKRKPGESKTVISSLQSNSATNQLLGPMLAKQTKKKKDDTKSAIG